MNIREMFELANAYCKNLFSLPQTDQDALINGGFQCIESTGEGLELESGTQLLELESSTDFLELESA